MKVLVAYTIRVAALALAVLMILASMPIAMLAGAAPSEYPSPVSPLLVIPACACVLASGFLYIGIAGRRMATSPWLRLLGGLLLVPTLVLGTVLLVHRNQWGAIGSFFLVPSATLFACTVWPWHLTPRQLD